MRILQSCMVVVDRFLVLRMQNIIYPIILIESDMTFLVTDVFLLQTSHMCRETGSIRTMMYKTSHHPLLSTRTHFSYNSLRACSGFIEALA